MNKDSYRIISLVYLLPISAMHFVNNTNSTGAAAHGSSLLFGLSIGLAAFAALPWIGLILGIEAAQAKPIEWVFNLALIFFCIYSFVDLANLNATSTDWLISPFSLLWHWLSVPVGAIAAYAFWAHKGEEVKHKLHDASESFKH